MEALLDRATFSLGKEAVKNSMSLSDLAQPSVMKGSTGGGSIPELLQHKGIWICSNSLLQMSGLTS